MDRAIKLNDGTVLDESEVLKSGERLFLYLYGQITFEQAFALLNDPDKTKKIVADKFGTKTTYSGYKELYVITKEDGGYITAGLRK